MISVYFVFSILKQYPIIVLIWFVIDIMVMSNNEHWTIILRYIVQIPGNPIKMLILTILNIKREQQTCNFWRSVICNVCSLFSENNITVHIAIWSQLLIPFTGTWEGSALDMHNLRTPPTRAGHSESRRSQLMASAVTEDIITVTELAIYNWCYYV